MIYIDFQGGTHGNYLEFICNKFLANVPTAGLPFNKAGASHRKKYLGDLIFVAGHYFEYLGKKTVIKDSKIVSIRVDYDDLLPLTSISLLRAGDYNIDNNELEKNTYNKWHNPSHQWVLDNLIDSFFKNQLQTSYNNVKDSTWPSIDSLDDFKKLPAFIQDECLNHHNLKLYELTPELPDCPRHILREFFKLSFKYPEQAGFISQQKKMEYDPSTEVWNFPYSSFYSTENFIKELTALADWAGYSFIASDEFRDLHAVFLSKQPYKDSKKYCDQLIERIISREDFTFTNLTLLEESYLTAKLELCYNTELPNNDIWFLSSREILESIEN